MLTPATLRETTPAPVRWRDLKPEQRAALPLGTVAHNIGVSSEVPGPPDPPMRLVKVAAGQWRSTSARGGGLHPERRISGYYVVEVPTETAASKEGK